MFVVCLVIFLIALMFLSLTISAAIYLLPVCALVLGFSNFPRRLYLLAVPIAAGVAYYWLYQNEHVAILERVEKYRYGLVVEEATMPKDLLYIVEAGDRLHCNSNECAHPLLSGQVQRVVLAHVDDPDFRQAVAYKSGHGAECKNAIIDKYGSVSYGQRGTRSAKRFSHRGLRLMGRCLLPAEINPVPDITIYRDKAYPGFSQIRHLSFYRPHIKDIWHVVRRHENGNEQLIAHFENLSVAPLAMPIRVEFSPLQWNTGGGGELRFVREHISYGKGRNFLERAFDYDPSAEIALRRPDEACPYMRVASQSEDEAERLAVIEVMEQFLPDIVYPALMQVALEDGSDDVARNAKFYFDKYKRQITPTHCKPAETIELPKQITCSPGFKIAAIPQREADGLCLGSQVRKTKEK